jgi:hypothetical protein
VQSRERAILQFATRRRATSDARLGGTADALPPAMIDLLLILSTAAFFGLSWGYARLCEKL